MSNRRQWVYVRFQKTDGRTYAYHNDGDPLAVGDRVEVATRDAVRNLPVERITFEDPGFVTKPIMRAMRQGVPA